MSSSQAWRLMPVISAHGKLKERDHQESRPSLDDGASGQPGLEQDATSKQTATKVSFTDFLKLVSFLLKRGHLSRRAEEMILQLKANYIMEDTLLSKTQHN